ncbi:MAG: polyprenyl synthetase family protein [Candidatus Moraniibacteriota bacterium]
MDVQDTLKDFKARLDPEMAAYFDELLKKTRKEDEAVADALEHVKKITLSGGKRLRPAFMYYGYLAAGGTDRGRILKTAIAVELIHMYLLIHDDIIDRDELRHGVPTLHMLYRDLGKKHFPQRDAEHFGLSIALIVGDMVAALGNDVIFRSGFPHENMFAALSELQGIITRTVVGEAKDVYMEYAGKATEAEILAMYDNKTARYTVEGPLHVGALLAGGSDELLEIFSRYALPLGVAFQIQDDILGVYGTTERTGKPVGSDIEEGKLTLLISRLLETGTEEDKKEISRILALHDKLTETDIDLFRKIMENSGSLAYAKKEAARRIEEGKRALLESTVPMNAEAKDFLLSIADYLATRDY